MVKYLYRIESLIFFIINHPIIGANLRSILTYSSILLFTVLVGFVSISVSDYINKTMSVNITIVENFQDQAPQLIEKEEVPAQSSVTVKVQKGDTIRSILAGQNLPESEVLQINKLIEETSHNIVLQTGNEILFNYELKLIESHDSELTTEVESLASIRIILDKYSIDVIRLGDTFTINTTTAPVVKVITKYTKVINSNLISTLQALGISSSNIAELINAYSYQVDFQRHVHHGDTITVMVEKFVTGQGQRSHHGKVLFASLALSGKTHNIYRYGNTNSFFLEDGRSVKRNLLKTPVNVMRISSVYGKRKHPIDGYTKLHKGIDFAAPEGTPIYAAGDGVITELGWKSGYGKFIQIKHSPTLSTAYAHAKNFAKGLSVGSRIKQGHVIGYVGHTGKATGDHLHYEVKIDGKHVNPLSIKTTPGIELNGNNLNKFHQFKSKIRNLNDDLDIKAEIVETEVNING